MSNQLFPFQQRPVPYIGGGPIDLSAVSDLRVKTSLEAMVRRIQQLEQAQQTQAPWLDQITQRFAADSSVTTKSASFTPDSEIEWYRVSASGGAVTVTIPLAVDNPYRTIGVIKTDSGTNAVTPTISGSDTINGATTFALSSQYNFVILKSDGISAWDVCGRSAASGETVISAAAANASTAVNDTNPVTIITKSVTGIAAGDQIRLDAWFTILNDSGANRQYSIVTNLGSLGVTSNIPVNISASATSRKPHHLVTQFAVSAANLTYVMPSLINGTNSSAADSATALETSGSGQSWDTTTSDLTGTQTLTLTASSNNNTATQTLTMHSYKITKTPTI